MKNMTAVEWLINELPKFGSGAVRTFGELFEQAKEMEKQRMFDFHIQVMKNGLEYENEQEWDDDLLPLILERAKETYNETFKSE